MKWYDWMYSFALSFAFGWAAKHGYCKTESSQFVVIFVSGYMFNDGWKQLIKWWKEIGKVR
jgi:hypothetical protein